MKKGGDVLQKLLPFLMQSCINMEAQNKQAGVTHFLNFLWHNSQNSRHIPSMNHSDFWILVKESLLLAFKPQKVFHKHIRNFRYFTEAVEFTSVRYLQMDLTEISRAAPHSSHILAVIHQMDEHLYVKIKKHHTNKKKTTQSRHAKFINVLNEHQSCFTADASNFPKGLPPAQSCYHD